MRKLWTTESPREGLPILGELLPASGSGEVCLRQRISIPDAGRFVKEKRLALLDEREMAEYQQQRESTLGGNDCLGVVSSEERPDPIGMVTYQDGWYQYYLPVYASFAFDQHWSTREYLPAGDGRFIAVARRRHTGRKITLFLLAILLAALGYLVYTYGWWTVWHTVSDTVTGWLTSWGLLK